MTRPTAYTEGRSNRPGAVLGDAKVRTGPDGKVDVEGDDVLLITRPLLELRVGEELFDLLALVHDSDYAAASASDGAARAEDPAKALLEASGQAMALDPEFEAAEQEALEMDRQDEAVTLATSVSETSGVIMMMVDDAVGGDAAPAAAAAADDDDGAADDDGDGGGGGGGRQWRKLQELEASKKQFREYSDAVDGAAADDNSSHQALSDYAPLPDSEDEDCFIGQPPETSWEEDPQQ
ncbi:hypothetical protein AK812_SmicGene11114 [Symbiodinium microadriaticum]|uniref:Uncharacterized protein n=1 Tax=Symbiodinium microadriaticum TaxID=2951 RepID=A0A1Q9EDZ5_SYMMI|nr:hypothetical protein AK812_SmicGene11114 [Symbiodinium microadriaticum]